MAKTEEKWLEPTDEVRQLAEMLGLRAGNGRRVENGTVYYTAPEPSQMFSCTGLPFYVYVPDNGEPEIRQGHPSEMWGSGRR